MKKKVEVSCIVPAYNEEATIKNVIDNIKKVRTVDEIIVVDDGSKDNTYSSAKINGVKVIRHKINQGKGAAIKTGVNHARGEILLFLDADLSNISPKKIASIIQPIREGKADFVKTSFSRKRGRVTELVVKPLFRVLMPFIDFNQPLSGQFAIRRGLMKDIRLDDKWGIDIQILLQMVKKGVKISEVDIGHLIHKKQPMESLAIMSEQVIKTALSELGIIANKHKLIIFDFDKTIIKGSSIEIIAQHFGFEKELKNLRRMKKDGKIKDRDITLNLAHLLKGKISEEFPKIAEKLTLTKNIQKVVERLKKRQYEMGIVSVAFSSIVNSIADKIGIKKENIICPELIVNSKGKFTGEVIAKTKHNSTCCDRIICKADAANELMGKFDVKPEECIAIGDGKTDECLFRACGFSLAFRPKRLIGDVVITNMTEVLIYAD